MWRWFGRWNSRQPDDDISRSERNGRSRTRSSQSSPQHSNKHALDLRHRRCNFGIIRSVEIIGETNPPFEDMKKLSLGQPGVRHGEGRRFHKL